MEFQAVVTSEPRTLAKGKFRGKLGEQGLTLSKKDQQFSLPIGSQVSYEGKNRMIARIPEGRLEIQISKFGSYQERLTQDMVDFLNRDGELPTASTYQMPYYFYAISALPLGIPIITLGGAIPGALGFGLAATCYGVAQQEQWSTSTRLAVCALIVAAGYMTLFTMFSIALYMQMQ